MKIGLATGCFDRFHEGHWYFMAQAAQHCEKLIIAVNEDSACRYKGAERPFQPLEARLATVRWRLFHTDVAIAFNGDHDALIEAIRPDVVIRGWDQSERPCTVPVIRIDRGPDVSTTSLAARRAFK
jgi:D-beta-D-heptose 7-phosphate kinase / D-beta-D-heptose 1-phosphate adenosyltransferase